jgi:tetratricopeptide (TPR) repeat protein
MSDDLFNSVLGGEDDKSDSAAPETPAGAEAFAAAIAAIASRQDPGVARETEEFLASQTALLKLQARHLRDEHASRLLHLKLVISAVRHKRYADRIRNGLYTCVALLVLALLVGATRMVIDAMTDGSLIVEGFTVPPDLVAQGASGEALANDFVTRLAAIRSLADHSFTQSRQVRGAQADAPKVQIPETGISLDELERFLHHWLGHQTVLAGQVLDEPDGRVAISMDVEGSAPIEVQGSRVALQQLMQQAAEQVFAVLDPVNFSNYLSAQGHNKESLQVAQRYARNPDLAALPPSERANAYSLLGNKDPDGRRALAEALVAVDLDPRVAFGWFEAAQASSDLGHDQAMVDFSRREFVTKLADQAPAERAAYPTVISLAHLNIDHAMGDYAAVERDVAELNRSTPSWNGLNDRYANSAETAALMHDEMRSRQNLARALIAGSLDTTVLTARWYVNSSAGDWAQALAAAKALVAGGAAQASAAYNAKSELTLETQYRPWLAYAEAMTGDTASATSLISQTAMDCYLCVRMRARIAAVAGDAAGTDRWFAEAVRQAPALPMAYSEWGQALLARGDLAGAAREFELAHEKGPHFADPLKGWGDVLAKQGHWKQGHWKQALAKYDQALRYAPSWAALKQARDAAAKQSG